MHEDRVEQRGQAPAAVCPGEKSVQLYGFDEPPVTLWSTGIPTYILWMHQIDDWSDVSSPHAFHSLTASVPEAQVRLSHVVDRGEQAQPRFSDRIENCPS